MYKYIFIFLYLLKFCFSKRTHVVLRLKSNFTDWLPLNLININCSYNVQCEMIKQNRKDVIGYIYNPSFYKYRKHYHRVVNIDANLEPQHIWRRTYKISEGKDSDFQFAVTYKLHYTKHNFAMSYYEDYDVKDLIASYKSSLRDSPFPTRKNAAVAIYSRYYTNRNKLVKMISKYIKVDTYGKAFNERYNQPKRELLKQYKFCIAIENSIETVRFGEMYSNEISDYYVTEKLLDCFRAGSIPIYFGPRNAKLHFPNMKSVIYSGDFINYEEMMKHIVFVSQNEFEMNEYLSWPNSYNKEWYKRFQVDYRYTSCRLCEYVKYFYMEKGHDKDEIIFDENDNIIKIN